MKKCALFILLLSVSLTVFGQQNDSKEAVDGFIKRFNEQKFEEIYDDFAPAFKEQVPRASGTGLLSQVFGITGQQKVDFEITNPDEIEIDDKGQIGLF